MPAHPLDPLSEDEFRSTAAILRRDRGVSQEWRFASIELAEPAKAAVKAWSSGDPVPRRSLSVVWEKATNNTYEAVVDLVADAVVSWTHVPGVCPNFTVDEYHDIDHALHEHDGGARGAGRSRDHRPLAGPVRRVDLRQAGDARAVA